MRYRGFTLEFEPFANDPGNYAKTTFPRNFTKNRRRGAGAFKAGWTATVDLFVKELNLMDANRATIRLALTWDDIRKTGEQVPKSTARPEHPGVQVVFTCKHGALSYACDEFEDWQANVRAVALTLERLRTAELYGCTSRGEQYAGFKALPGPGAPVDADLNGFATAEEAFEWMRTEAGIHSGSAIDLSIWQVVYRTAAKLLHPDAGGDVEKFKRLQKAKEVLEQVACPR